MVPVFSQRREGRAEVREDAVGDLLAGRDVCCSPGAAWDLRRCFVFRPSSSLLPGAVAPHSLFFLRLCCLCGLAAGGVSCGVSACFPLWFFMVSAGQIWRIVLGCVVTLLGWGEYVWAVSILLVDAFTREG